MNFSRIWAKLAIGCLVIVGARGAVAQVSSSNANPTRPRLTAEQMRADLASFRTEFFARDRSYAAAARAEAESRLQRFEGALDRMSPAAFELALSRVVALADNGHTVMFPAERARHFNRVLVRLTPFGSEFRVLRATDANADLLGARLVAIDGHAVAELRDSARTLTGGTAAWRDRNVNYLLESPEQLNALGLARRSNAATYSFQTADGKNVDRQLTGEMAADAPRGGADRWLYPELLRDETGRWRALLATSQAPWALQEPDAPFRWRVAPEMDGMVVQLRQVHDAPNRTIGDFLNEMTQKIQAQHPRNLVVDMRLNGGGDLNTARDFMKSLPTLVSGRIFALTSPWTFSAAISSVGYLEQAAPDRVTIVGEEVGDRLEFWSEGRVVRLPQSGLMILYALERHDYKTGCRGFTDCHGPVVRNPIAVPTLAPNIPAPLTFEAYRAGRDPAMEAVAAALKR